jgi:hypothetical protein
MNEIQIYIVVEGPTEQTFIRDVHEFEALLFSDANILAEKAGVDIQQIQRIINEFGNPEEINDDPAKSPSKRLEELTRLEESTNKYRKVAMGKTVSEAIGIQAMRKQCPHFADWLIKLENLK